MAKQSVLKAQAKRARGYIGQRTSIEERPIIPCRKVFLSGKDKSLSRAARKRLIRDARDF